MVETQSFSSKKPSFDKFEKMKKCTPTCEFFRCSQRALRTQNNKGRKTAWCNFVPGGDYCQGANCNYGFCAKHKLKPGNICGLYTKPIKKQVKFEEEEREWENRLQFKDKVLKKLKSKRKFDF